MNVFHTVLSRCIFLSLLLFISLFSPSSASLCFTLILSCWGPFSVWPGTDGLTAPHSVSYINNCEGILCLSHCLSIPGRIGIGLAWVICLRLDQSLSWGCELVLPQGSDVYPEGKVCSCEKKGQDKGDQIKSVVVTTVHINSQGLAGYSNAENLETK